MLEYVCYKERSDLEVFGDTPRRVAGIRIITCHTRAFAHHYNAQFIIVFFLFQILI
jgi:hypothetical protein